MRKRGIIPEQDIGKEIEEASKPKEPVVENIYEIKPTVAGTAGSPSENATTAAVLPLSPDANLHEGIKSKTEVAEDTIKGPDVAADNRYNVQGSQHEVDGGNINSPKKPDTPKASFTKPRPANEEPIPNPNQPFFSSTKNATANPQKNPAGASAYEQDHAPLPDPVFSGVPLSSEQSSVKPVVNKPIVRREDIAYLLDQKTGNGQNEESPNVDPRSLDELLTEAQKSSAADQAKRPAPYPRGQRHPAHPQFQDTKAPNQNPASLYSTPGMPAKPGPQRPDQPPADKNSRYDLVKDLPKPDVLDLTGKSFDTIIPDKYKHEAVPSPGIKAEKQPVDNQSSSGLKTDIGSEKSYTEDPTKNSKPEQVPYPKLPATVTPIKIPVIRPAEPKKETDINPIKVPPIETSQPAVHQVAPVPDKSTLTPGPVPINPAVTPPVTPDVKAAPVVPVIPDNHEEKVQPVEKPNKQNKPLIKLPEKKEKKIPDPISEIAPVQTIDNKQKEPLLKGKKNRKSIDVTITVSVCSLGKGMGCSHFSRSIVSYVEKYLKKKACIVNFSGQLEMEGYNVYPKEALTELYDEYDFIVLDFGKYEQKFDKEIMRAPIRIMCSFFDDNYVKELADFIKGIENPGKWNYFFNHVPKNKKKKVAELMEDYQYWCAPVFDDSELDKETVKVYEEILGGR